MGLADLYWTWKLRRTWDTVGFWEHAQWFVDRIRRPNYLRIEGYYHGNIGVLRADGAFISIHLNPLYWGVGLGTAVLQAIGATDDLYARVSYFNRASQRAFEKAGWKVYRKGRAWLYYRSRYGIMMEPTKAGKPNAECSVGERLSPHVDDPRAGQGTDRQGQPGSQPS